ncbi:MAG: HD domain-containing protein [Candidatus Cloacimonetes bacterium]|nr:HD domain-containing protein [Candidatus Cloacimonadota bacterium]
MFQEKPEQDGVETGLWEEEILFAPEAEEESKIENPAQDSAPQTNNLKDDFCNWNILVVDDEEDVHTVTRMLFEGVTFAGKPVEIIDAYSGREAQNILNGEKEIALIFLDVVMETNQAGLELVVYLRNELHNNLTRVILRTGQPGEAPESRVILEYEIEDYKLKTELTAQKMITSLIGGLRSYANLRGLGVENRKRLQAESDLRRAYQLLDNVFEQTVESLTSLLEIRDSYTAGHARNVGILAEKIGAKLGLDESRCRVLRLSGYLHDIGKNRIPLELLSKVERLTNAEWEMIREHPATGYEVLRAIDYPWPLAEIVYQHHERLDGNGYPRGKSGNEILLEAQILGVADVMEAIMLARPYREALGKDNAFLELESLKDSSFNAGIVDACTSVFAEGFKFNEK